MAQPDGSDGPAGGQRSSLGWAAPPRGHVRRVADDAGGLDIARFLVSELVTNAVIHGRSSPRLDVGAAASGALYVGVGDDNSRYPVVQDDDDESLSGRGLRLLESLALRWGVRADPPGKVVWFELDAGAG